MTKEVLKKLDPLFGQKVCKTRVWRYKSLMIGFGKKMYHNDPTLIDSFNGEWELGTHYSSWRILKKKKILIGSNDSTDIKKLNKKVKKIKFGKIISIRPLTKIDTRVEFDNNICVDFLSTFGDSSEDVFFIFCPDNIYIGLKSNGDWYLEKCAEPIKNA